MDIINIASHGRKKDLISLLTGLLEINTSESIKKSLFQTYANSIDKEWKEFVPKLNHN